MMACDTMVRNREAQRLFDHALEQLRDDLEAGRRKILRNILTGQVSISGWKETQAAATGWCEGCAIRSLETKGWASASLKAGGITKSKPFVVASHNHHKH